ncbi:MAG: choice-of-anchor B family protein [Planctomycetes bacterium]|nr:choice-of-anchor B family protein [Planctomycetota bacterium]
MTRFVTTAFALSLAASFASAHDDDGKILDRKPYFRGEAWRLADPANGGAAAATAFPSSGLVLTSWLTIPSFGPKQVAAASCSGYTSPSGREYALIALSNGTGVVEVTDPTNAKLISVVFAKGSFWGDVRAYSHYAYAVKETPVGLQVIDLDNVDAGQVTLVDTITSPGPDSTHTLAIDQTSGFLYRAGGGGNGLRIYDLVDPKKPTFVAEWQTRYVHEVTPVTYTSGPYAGRQIAFACSGFNNGWVSTGIDILDVTDKAHITSLSQAFWPNAGYSHQAWPSADMKYLFVDDEYDELHFQMPTSTIVFDIQDLSNPVYLGRFSNGNQAISHNVYVKGNLLFEANYTSGLRVFDVTQPLTPTEIAWFDTEPANDQPTFNSLWNIYPYFKSGTIIGSDIEKGLFVWRFAGLPAPATYCQAKANSQGCVPTIAASGAPSVSSPSPFVVAASNFLNRSQGLLFYGTDDASLSFHGGTLCVKSPLSRTPVQASGGTGSPTIDCSGAFAFDFNAFLRTGGDPTLQPGTQVRCQYWSPDLADPTGFHDSLSNALSFNIGL